MAPNPPNAAFSEVFNRERFVCVCVLLSVGCALAVLAGWVFDIPILRAVLPGLPETKPAAAGGFLLLAFGLFLSMRDENDRRFRWSTTVIGGIVATLSFSVLAAYLFHFSTKIDTALIPELDPTGASAGQRFSPVSTLSLVLLGVSMALLRWKRFRQVSGIFVVLAMVATYGAVIGHFYHADTFYGFSGFNGMPLPSSLLVFIAGSGLLWRNHEFHLMRLLSSDSLGGAAARRLIPYVILIPTLIGWLRVAGQDLGLYDTGFGTTISIFTIVILTLATVLFYSRTIHIADRKRQLVEAELADKEMRYRELFDYSQGLICTHDLKGRLVTVNRAAQTLLGYTHEQLAGLNMRALLRVENWPAFDAYLRQVTNEGLADGLLELVKKNGDAVMVKYHNVLVAEPGKEPYILGHAEDVSALLAAQAELRNLSLTDDLTGLFNRRGFLTLAEQQLKLERHGRTARGLTLMFADLDGLKQINDQYGHEAGSDAIITFAQLVKSVVRDADLLARWGGDEFVLLSIGSHDEHAAQVIGRIQARIAEHNNTSDKPYEIACSIGVAPLRVDDGRSIEQIIAEADEAMYAEKKRRKSDRNSLQDPLPNIPAPFAGDIDRPHV